MVVRMIAPAAQRGDIVTFITRGEMGHGFDGELVTKMVGGLPGDVILVKDDVLYINGKKIGELDLVEKLGKSRGAFDRSETVPSGFLFVIGTEPRSYDGRYWGFLPKRELVGKAYPLDPLFDASSPSRSDLARQVLGAV
jgi:conjugal transfer pilin signal peptidase TrbI